MWNADASLGADAVLQAACTVAGLNRAGRAALVLKRAKERGAERAMDLKDSIFNRDVREVECARGKLTKAWTRW